MNTELYVRYTDKTGRGFKSLTKITVYQNGENSEEDNYDGESFNEWITNPDIEDGDTFESRTSRFEIIDK